MIVLDLDNEVDTWLEKLPEQLSGLVRLNLDTFVIANGMENEVLLVHSEIYNKIHKSLKKKLEKFDVIFIWDNGKSTPKEILANVMGIFDSEPSHLFSNANLLNYITDSLRTKSVMKSQLMSLGHEVNEAFGGVSQQLIRIKKFYEANAPKRIDESKGVKVYSKYCAGSDIGGEFFDLFSTEKKIFFMMSRTDSYLLSSSVLTLFSDLKQSPVISNKLEENFLNDLSQELKTFNANSKIEKNIEVLTAVLDLATLELSGHMFGGFKIINSSMQKNVEIIDGAENILSNIDLEKTKFLIELDRDERVILSSPGLDRNWKSENRENAIEDVVMNRAVKPLDTLDEVFFQMKKNSQTDLLGSDSSAIILEVDKNVMVKL